MVIDIRSRDADIKSQSNNFSSGSESFQVADTAMQIPSSPKSQELQVEAVAAAASSLAVVEGKEGVEASASACSAETCSSQSLTQIWKIQFNHQWHWHELWQGTVQKEMENSQSPSKSWRWSSAGSWATALLGCPCGWGHRVGWIPCHIIKLKFRFNTLKGTKLNQCLECLTLTTQLNDWLRCVPLGSTSFGKPALQVGAVLLPVPAAAQAEDEDAVLDAKYLNWQCQWPMSLIGWNQWLNIENAPDQAKVQTTHRTKAPGKHLSCGSLPCSSMQSQPPVFEEVVVESPGPLSWKTPEMKAHACHSRHSHLNWWYMNHPGPGTDFWMTLRSPLRCFSVGLSVTDSDSSTSVAAIWHDDWSTD